MPATSGLHGRFTLHILGRAIDPPAIVGAVRLLVRSLGGILLLVPVMPYAPTASGQPPEMPPARGIPGITVEDQFPRACVDCHVNYEEMNRDTRLSTLIAQWTTQVEPQLLETAQAVAGPGLELTGVHPRVNAALGDIPAACLGCHESKAANAPPLPPLLHKIHLGGGDEAVFLRVFQGECTHCHKLNKDSGQWWIPSGAEN